MRFFQLFLKTFSSVAENIYLFNSAETEAEVYQVQSAEQSEKRKKNQPMETSSRMTSQFPFLILEIWLPLFLLHPLRFRSSCHPHCLLQTLSRATYRETQMLQKWKAEVLFVVLHNKGRHCCMKSVTLKSRHFVTEAVLTFQLSYSESSEAIWFLSPAGGWCVKSLIAAVLHLCRLFLLSLHHLIKGMMAGGQGFDGSGRIRRGFERLAEAKT